MADTENRSRQSGTLYDAWREEKTAETHIQKPPRKKNWYWAAILIAVAVVVCAAVFLKGGSRDNPSHLTEAFFENAKPGSSFLLGKYEQDNQAANGPEDIEWTVLADYSGYLLAVSKYCLEDMPFNDASFETPTDWESCTLRQWLNQDFYNSAFTQEEKGFICLTTVENGDNEYFGIDGGNDTSDHVFLLDLETIQQVYPDYGFGIFRISTGGGAESMEMTVSDFTEYEPLKAQYTEYAKQKYIAAEPNLDYAEMEKEDGENACYWWTRIRGDHVNAMMEITSSGGAASCPAKANTGIRPVILISRSGS